MLDVGRIKPLTVYYTAPCNFDKTTKAVRFPWKLWLTTKYISTFK